MRNYQEAAEYLGKKADRPLGGKATRLIRIDAEHIAVRYHSTNVVTYAADGSTVLKTDGYRTLTTKARINEYTTAQVYSDKSVWYLALPGVSFWERGSARAVFVDGMTIKADGSFDIVPPDDTETKRRQLDKMVRAYVKGYVADVLASGKLPVPSGDCFACCMRPVSERTGYMGHTLAAHPVKTEGMGFDHYLSHFEESYYVPSILYNAMKAQGYGPAWPMMMQADIARGDGRSVQRCLSGFFRKIKPNLLMEMER